MTLRLNYNFIGSMNFWMNGETKGKNNSPSDILTSTGIAPLISIGLGSSYCLSKFCFFYISQLCLGILPSCCESQFVNEFSRLKEV